MIGCSILKYMNNTLRHDYGAVRAARRPPSPRAAAAADKSPAAPGAVYIYIYIYRERERAI